MQIFITRDIRSAILTIKNLVFSNDHFVSKIIALITVNPFNRHFPFFLNFMQSLDPFYSSFLFLLYITIKSPFFLFKFTLLSHSSPFIDFQMVKNLDDIFFNCSKFPPESSTIPHRPYFRSYVLLFCI